VKNSLKIFCGFLFILVCQNEKSSAQIIKGDEEQQNLLEQQSQNTDAESESYEDVEELALTLQLHPHNLDRATEEELKQLVEMGIINELQLQSLISYRKHFGKFLSIYELQAVPYFDLQTIQNLSLIHI
jgi:DNA uptake protein ComE-like DNA-binding protein